MAARKAEPGEAAAATPALPEVALSVRDLVHFVLRSGDLAGSGLFQGSNRALEGTRGHQRLQKLRTDFETEVAVSIRVPGETFSLLIRGRIDCLRRTPAPAVLEEIKTVTAGWDGEPDPLHWAQAEIYGHIICVQSAGKASGTLRVPETQNVPASADAVRIDRIELRLTYLQLDLDIPVEFRKVCTAQELADNFERVAGEYMEWARAEVEWRRTRDDSIRALQFPFAYRPGQRALAVAAYRAIASGGRLFAEAPTGIGKTISVMFPAIKALAGHATTPASSTVSATGETPGTRNVPPPCPSGLADRLFYLTARTIGRTVAEKAAADLRRAGLRMRAVTLTAKEKLCVDPQGNRCDPRTCPLALGYYDRLKPALREVLTVEELTRSATEEIARRHGICPFEFSLDASLFADLIICDYNYAFDPSAYLRRYFQEETGPSAPGRRFVFLVDEAHNLPDRAREMFSAEIRGSQLRDLSRAVRKDLPQVARAIDSASRRLRELITDPAAPLTHDLAPTRDDPPSRIVSELPETVRTSLQRVLEVAEPWLAANTPAPFRELLMQHYFEITTFLRTAEGFDERYVAILQQDREAPDEAYLKLFCLDPSKLLGEALARGTSAIFFSATLTPLPFYHKLLGGGAAHTTLRLPSPFPPEHLEVVVADRVATTFKHRAATIPDVAQMIYATILARPGNYLVFFPSYLYLRDVAAAFREIAATSATAGTSHVPVIDILLQENQMSEASRESFLASFRHDHTRPLVGFAVMGGIFGEGIDLIGDRLHGAVIVGPGLPQLSLERELIRNYFQSQAVPRQHQGSAVGADAPPFPAASRDVGFACAYLFPGMTKVQQAAGRVIRSDTDRGVVVLIDSRFRESRYSELFPPWWNIARARSARDVGAILRDFWSRGQGDGAA
ncbi:ATP-dependent helicase [Verrucomicrobia bacterium LW23]|nr:ATP-dependent helicase [Verrucomicrobia bacterium LW23]